MTEEETDELRRRCQECNPTKLRLYRDEEHLRDVPITSSRKKWARALRVVAELRPRWTSVELCDRGDNVLDVFQPATSAKREPIVLDRASDSEKTELLRVMLLAQREVLTYRERESSAAMAAMVGMMERVTTAVGTLANVHAATLEAQRQHNQVQLATVAQAAAAAATTSETRTSDDDDVDESMGIVKALAPQLGEQIGKAVVEKFGPLIMSMLKSSMGGAAPAAAATKKTVIDVPAANANGSKGAA